MATRPAWKIENNKVVKNNFDFTWNPGLAPSQKRKNIKALHESIGEPTLEVSTKAMNEFGQSLSPFNLKVDGIPMETVYHASKKYEEAGPFVDLLFHKPLVAKRDPRHEDSGKLVAFELDEELFPLEPRTYFFNYLYYKAVQESIKADKLDHLNDYTYFTDIEFNPNKGVSNQARAITLVKAIYNKFGELPELTAEEFLELQNEFLTEEETLSA